MGTLSATQREALALVVSAVLEAIGAAGAHGAPAGVLYAGMMAQGCKLTQFTSLMSALVSAGKVRRVETNPRDPGECLYFIA